MSEPTTEQMQTVINYARRWGKGWKERLIDQCTYGSEYRHDRPLQQVFNKFGEAWVNQQPEEYPLT